MEDPDEIDLEQAYRDALSKLESLDLPIQFTEGPPDPLEQPSPIPAAASLQETEFEAPPVSEVQIIEAALFTGGISLPAKKLCSLLGPRATIDLIERIVDSLNDSYRLQNRPYEIRHGEGGYQLSLCSEFEGVRSRVYGAGPKEVKLSQEALEILALIAYKQPLTHEEVERLGKKGSGNVLRQLLRRELIQLQRDEDQVIYETSARFLNLFGLSNLNELPKLESLEFK